jgi:ATP-dependent protease ClpP protease subunit
MTHRRMRVIWIIVGLALLSTSLSFAQQSPDSQVPQTVILNFVGEINTGSVTALLHVVSDQANKGTKKIILLISSPGGDTSAAFTAYNILRHMNVELTTFVRTLPDYPYM